MPTTLLATKSDPTLDAGITKSDDHQAQLASDPTLSSLPQGSAFGSAPAATTTSSSFGGTSNGGFGSSTTGASTFGAPASGGFGSTSTGFGSTSSTGASGFGNSGSSFGGSPGYGTQTGYGQQVNTNQITQGNMNTNAAAASNAADDAEVLVKNDNNDWINKKWRPMMGWMYMATCTADFVVFPILWSLLQALSHGQVTSQWQPLTLQGAGLYHVAMGAVLGIAAYGRTKEKVAGAA